jgi:hypothetical protein
MDRIRRAGEGEFVQYDEREAGSRYVYALEIAASGQQAASLLA